MALSVSLLTVKVLVHDDLPYSSTRFQGEKISAGLKKAKGPTCLDEIPRRGYVPPIYCAKLGYSVIVLVSKRYHGAGKLPG